MNNYNVFSSGPRKGEPKTLTDRIVRFLTEGLHCVEIRSKSKYRQFSRSIDPLSYYFIGKAGAVRAGKNASNSISLTNHVKANMHLWERKKGLI